MEAKNSPRIEEICADYAMSKFATADHQRVEMVREISALRASKAELLEALQLAYRYINGGSDLYPGLHHDAYTAARAAIAKATA